MRVKTSKKTIFKKNHLSTLKSTAQFLITTNIESMPLSHNCAKKKSNLKRPELGSNPFVTSALTATAAMHIDYWENANFNSFSLLSLFVAGLQLKNPLKLELHDVIRL
jgi:hypothetical protein